MKNKLNLTTKIVASLIFALIIFVAIASANYASETNSDCEGNKCTKKCERNYQKDTDKCTGSDETNCLIKADEVRQRCLDKCRGN